MYRVSNGKRGNAIGTISKTLFGTMVAEDSAYIHKQLQLLQNWQKLMRHVAKDQLKVINATFGYMEASQQTIFYNENLIKGITDKLEQQEAILIQRE